MTDYNYEDFPFEKDVNEWTNEEVDALFDAVAEIDDELAEILGRA
jgi:hypothetical protein